MVNIQITNHEIKLLYEALTYQVKSAPNQEEQNIQGMTVLREKFNEIRKLLNPS